MGPTVVNPKKNKAKNSHINNNTNPNQPSSLNQSYTGAKSARVNNVDLDYPY